ncbi:MAG: fibronectin type III domain-containing protein [Anaerolineae bacterium]|nr:fibronectin type III domain-containing protein [Anaerolineae bacterium]
MMRTIQEDYPAPAFESAMNLLGSHDTNRPVRVLDHDGIAGGQPVNGFQDGRERLALLAVVQMTVPGAPTIYYGDEVGLAGYGSDIPRDDPYNRQPYPWSDEAGYGTLPAWRQADTDLLQHYRTLTSLRNSHSFLRTGSWNTLETDDANKVLVYGRRDNTGVAVIAINRSDGLEPGTSLTVGAARTMTFNVSGMGARVWVSRPGLDMTRPSAPTGLTASEGSGSVILNWDAPADAVVAGYHVHRSVVDGGYEQISAALVLGTTYTDNTVHNGLQYYYNVKAVTPAGLKSQASAPAMPIPALHHWLGQPAMAAGDDARHQLPAIAPTPFTVRRGLMALLGSPAPPQA